LPPFRRHFDQPFADAADIISRGHIFFSFSLRRFSLLMLRQAGFRPRTATPCQLPPPLQPYAAASQHSLPPFAMRYAEATPIAIFAFAIVTAPLFRRLPISAAAIFMLLFR